MKKGNFGSLSCTVQDYMGRTSPVKVNKVPSKKCTLANAEKLGEFVAGKTNGRIVGFGCSVSAQDDGDADDDGKYDRVLQRIEMNFSDLQAGASRTFGIPAPKNAQVNDDQEPNSDLPEDVRDLLATLGVVSDKGDLVYNGGGLKSRKPPKGERSTKTTGV